MDASQLSGHAKPMVEEHDDEHSKEEDDLERRVDLKKDSPYVLVPKRKIQKCDLIFH